MKNKHYNIFFTSERDGQGKTFRVSSFSLYIGMFFAMSIIIFAYIGISYITHQDKFSKELKELREYKKAVEPILIELGVLKETVYSTNNLEELIIRIIMENNLIYPGEAPIDGIVYDYVTKKISNNNNNILYSGIDIVCKSKDKVKSPLQGEVEFTGTMDYFGNYIILKHDNNFKTMYGYLDKVLVQTSDVINQGQTIAQVGKSSNNKHHLYYEIRKGNVIIDPRHLIYDYKEKDVSIR